MKGWPCVRRAALSEARLRAWRGCKKRMLLANLYVSEGRQAEKKPPGLTSIRGNKGSNRHADPDSSCLTDPKKSLHSNQKDYPTG